MQTLVEMIYKATEAFPKQETYGLAVRLRRAAVSVPANIAEGAARNSTKELVQFPGFAHGSLSELETLPELAARLGYIDAATGSLQQVSRVGKFPAGLRNAMREKAAWLYRSRLPA